MANRLYVESVHLRYLKRSPENCNAYGFIVFDDSHRHEVLDFESETEIPKSFEDFLRHISFDDHTEAWDLIIDHVVAGNGLSFEGSWIDREEVFELIEKLKDEADE